MNKVSCYKVIKAFNDLEKGDVLNRTEDDTFFIEKESQTEFGDKYFSIELSEETAEILENDGYLLGMDDEDEEDSKLEEIKEYVDTLIDTYTNDFNSMMEAYNEGDIQTCVKVEAETVYHNLIKVLNSIKNKINE
nr:MAG TPA: hypothetical protein [Caudoviricetes sp.]